MALKTNYVNDEFTGNRKYEMTTNSDGTVSLEDKTEYTVEGDIFGASDINDTNTAINEATTTISLTLSAGGWTSSAPYKQTLSNSAIKAKYDYGFYAPITGVQSTDTAIINAYACISGGTNTDGSVTFYCYEQKPSVDLSIRMCVKGTV